MAISKEAQSVYDLAQFPLKPRSCNLLSDLRIQTRKKIEPSVESVLAEYSVCLLYTSPSPRDQRGSGVRGCG